MRDAHVYYAGRRVCLALEPDLSVQTSRWLTEMGADVALSVIPSYTESASGIQAKKIIVGDLSAVKGDFDLLISNSHAEDTTRLLGVPLYQAGFPVYKVLGANARLTIGYRGTLAGVHEVGNRLMEVHR
jgi:nitrogenase molybdenum-iron protein alpha/beta subunit